MDNCKDMVNGSKLDLHMNVNVVFTKKRASGNT